MDDLFSSAICLKSYIRDLCPVYKVVRQASRRTNDQIIVGYGRENRTYELDFNHQFVAQVKLNIGCSNRCDKL
jgi:hypothetical protein